MKSELTIFPVVIAAILSIDAATAHAQRDRVYTVSSGSVTGAVERTASRGIQLSKDGNTQTIAAGDIEKILYEGDPPALTRGRELALGGQYEQALNELKKIKFDDIPRKVIEADAVFYVTLCEAKLALSGKGRKDQAVKRTKDFASRYKDSWHLYEAAKLLGDLALSLNDPASALNFYRQLSNAVSPDTKIESMYLQSRAHLKDGDTASAMAGFEKVIGIKPQTAKSARLQNLSKAGKAAVLAADNNAKQGLDLATSMIAELNPADNELAARIYNAQGANYEAAGDLEGAVLAYLHTHLMFSAEPDAHVEALKRLVELWPKIGKPDRGAEARQELQQRYPGF